MDDEDLAATTKRVRRLVCIAAGGRIDEADIADETVDLRQVGLDSLGYLNLLEGLERAFGIAIDLEQHADHSFLHTIANIARFVASQRAGSAA